MHVPFVDLAAQYNAHREEFDGALAAVIARTAFVGGEFVRNFERQYADAYGVQHCVSCANGSARDCTAGPSTAGRFRPAVRPWPRSIHPCGGMPIRRRIAHRTSTTPMSSRPGCDKPIATAA